MWDNLRFQEPVVDVADPWITLAAMATATERIRLGPMVTPLARRRPVKVARETATLDGSAVADLRWRRPGERPVRERVLDHRRGARRPQTRKHARRVARDTWRPPGRANRCTTAATTTQSMVHAFPAPAGPAAAAYRWGAGYYGKPRPVRRAARHQGFFPLGLDHPEQLAVVARLAALRTEAGRDPTEPIYDVVVALPPGDDPAPYAAAGATWWLVEFPWDASSIDQVRAVIRRRGRRLRRRCPQGIPSRGTHLARDTRPRALRRRHGALFATACLQQVLPGFASVLAGSVVSMKSSSTSRKRCGWSRWGK